ncbi:MAG: hypothetical protein R3D71_03870 [Rickettsiales bacterium]
MVVAQSVGTVRKVTDNTASHDIANNKIFAHINDGNFKTEQAFPDLTDKNTLNEFIAMVKHISSTQKKTILVSHPNLNSNSKDVMVEINSASSPVSFAQNINNAIKQMNELENNTDEMDKFHKDAIRANRDFKNLTIGKHI